MKIAIIIPALNVGGAERTAVALANWLADNTKNNVYLINLGINKGVYEVSENVYFLQKESCDNRIKNYFKVIRFLKKEKIEVIFEMLFTPLRLAIPYKLIFNRNVKIIGSERANPKLYQTLKGTFRSKISPYVCDGYVFQTKAVQEMFSNKIISKSIVIPNAISNPQAYTTKKQKKEMKRIVGVGRLTWAKGFDILIDAFELVLKKYPSHKLYIYGEGILEKELKEKIKNKKLEKSIFLMGNSPDVLTEISKSDIFVLSSRYEGMPNVLMESMAIGMPCVSTNCVAGPAELINNYENGILTDEISAIELSKKIIELLDNKMLRDKLGKNATKIINTNSCDIIYSRFNEYFYNVSKSTK